MDARRWNFLFGLVLAFPFCVGIAGCAGPEYTDQDADKTKQPGDKSQGSDSKQTAQKSGTDSESNKSEKPNPSVEKPANPPMSKAEDDDRELPKTGFVLGNLVKEKYDPPSLADLEKKVAEGGGWLDRRVIDGLDLLRKRQAGEKVLATPAEALKLRNDSAKNNEIILSALGRLPEKSSDVNFNASIKRHTPADVKSTNPLFASSTAEFEVNGLLGLGLIGFDWNFETFAPSDVVTSWQSSKDRLVDKFVLRDDLTWSDGKPVTAYDFEFSFFAVMSKGVPVTSRTAEAQLKWVKAYDDRTLVIFHKESLATNDWNCGLQLIPKHIYEKSIYEDPTLQNSPYNVKYENNPVVSGAYKITKLDRSTEIVLTLRDEWMNFKGKKVREQPYFKEVRFRVLPEPNTALLAQKKGDIDAMILNPQQWITQTDDGDFYKNNTKAYGTEWTEFHVIWNCESPFFSDKRVRKAMSYAIDYKELLGKLRYGLDQASNGPFHPNSRWSPKDPAPPYQRDLDKAEDLLDEAGWVDSNDDGFRDKKIDGRTVKFEFTILVSNKQDRIDICNLIRDNLAQIGIIVNVKPVEFTVLQDLLMKNNFQATFGGWGTGADPYTLENIFATKNERNYGQYSNKEVDDLFRKGLRELNPTKREAIYARIHEILFEDQPYTWLYYQSSFYAFNKSLRGYVYSPRGPYNYSPGFSSMWMPVD